VKHNKIDQFTFLFLTDTHIGNDGTGWGHHPVRPDLVPRLIESLKEWIDDNSIDMLLHGGDIIDDGSVEQQLVAKEIFSQLPVPVRLCLGNHDVTSENSLSNWLPAAPEFFENKTFDYIIESDLVDLYVLACGWSCENQREALWWNRELPAIPAVFLEQLDWLEKNLSERRKRPAILAVHASLDPLPERLTGQNEPTHVPPDEFSGAILNLLNQYSNVKLVLSGHCHATCLTRHGSRVHLSTSSFCEPPFQIRKIMITSTNISVKTFNLVDFNKMDIVFLPEKTWTAGKAEDIGLNISLY